MSVLSVLFVLTILSLLSVRYIRNWDIKGYMYGDGGIPDICHGRHGHVRVNFFLPM